MESIWTQQVVPEKRPGLFGDITTEAVVIGAGMAGILIAYHLQAAGIKTVVLEAKRVGSGQTQGTTAKITSQHHLIYHRLMQDFGPEQAKQYATANERAIQSYSDLVEHFNIDCDFKRCSSYLYSLYQEDCIRQETKAAREAGIQAVFTKETELPFEIEAAMEFKNQATFQPLKFLYALADRVTVYEHTRAMEVEQDRVITDKGVVHAKYIIFATHYPFINHPGYYFMRMHQERGYVLALNQVPVLEGVYRGVDQDGLSLRSFGSYLLLGGANHRTGENKEGGRYQALKQTAGFLWPDSVQVAAWSAQDCMTLDQIPYIGQFSSSTPNWYVATGFGKWGMTGSMVSAMAITDQICEKDVSSWQVFSPQRFQFSASAKNLFEDSITAAKGLSKMWLTPPKELVEKLPLGHGGIVEYDQEKAGVYRDEQGKVYAVSPRCPHLGCQLEWNPDELSWDCPCHGSRFDYQGNLMDNPAQEDLKNKS